MSVTVSFDNGPMLDRLRKVAQTFSSQAFDAVVTEVHDKAAIDIQKGMAEELDAKVGSTGRPQQNHTGPGGHKSGALRLSLLDERNRFSDMTQMAVGLESWLDKSPAQNYWRSIEQGMGTWSGEATFSNGYTSKRYGPWSPGGMSRNLAGVMDSRNQPPGYKHHRLWQSGPFVSDIGPYPAYRYSRGGARAFRQIQFGTRYKRAFARVGIELSLTK